MADYKKLLKGLNEGGKYKVSQMVILKNRKANSFEGGEKATITDWDGMLDGVNYYRAVVHGGASKGKYITELTDEDIFGLAEEEVKDESSEFMEIHENMTSAAAADKYKAMYEWDKWDDSKKDRFYDWVVADLGAIDDDTGEYYTKERVKEEVDYFLSHGNLKKLTTGGSEYSKYNVKGGLKDDVSDEDSARKKKSEAFMEKTIDNIGDLGTYIRRIIQTDKELKEKLMSNGLALEVANAMMVMNKFASFLSKEMDSNYGRYSDSTKIKMNETADEDIDSIINKLDDKDFFDWFNSNVLTKSNPEKEDIEKAIKGMGKSAKEILTDYRNKDMNE